MKHSPLQWIRRKFKTSPSDDSRPTHPIEVPKSSKKAPQCSDGHDISTSRTQSLLLPDPQPVPAIKHSPLQWIQRKSKTPPSGPTSSPDDAKSGKKAQWAVDTFTLALDLAEQALAIAEVAPFVAPAAALVRKIIDSYDELKSANDERDVLAAYVADLTGDICATVLRMEETKHSDQIGRLKQDLEKYSAMIKRASEFINTYDARGKISRFGDRKQLTEEMAEFTRELNSFGARFANNRLVDLYINQGTNARVLQEVSETVAQEKLETWLGSPPDMKQMQNDTEKLRTEGTGQWFLQDERFIEWENNAGILWIEGPSGAGKSVLRNKDAQNVEIMLRRIILQLSAASPHPYRILNDQYKGFNGQRLPSYQDLIEILKRLLRELGRTYIVLDALDECNAAEFGKLVDLVAILRLWKETPLHVLLTSQTRPIFTTGLKGIPKIPLQFELQQADIKRFITSELDTNLELAAWKSQEDKVVDGIVDKSNGMFRLASCLLHALASCLYGEPGELEKTLESLPNDLFTIYDRFMEAIPQNYRFYAEAALRWILFSAWSLSPMQLADAISFDFTSGEYTYKPSRRGDNEGAILKWFGGLIVMQPNIWSVLKVMLAHASVQDYLFSDHFRNKFSIDLCEGISHAFIFRTCISYLLYFGHHPPPDDSEYRDTVKYPLLEYAAEQWYYHLSCSHDQEALLPMAMQVLEEGSQLYRTILLSTGHRWELDLSPLNYCCTKGYIKCVCCLVGNGVDLNRESRESSPLSLASYHGHKDIIQFLLKNGANINLVCGAFGSALAAASYMGNTEIVCLLLKSGADVNLAGGHYGNALAAASYHSSKEIVHLLLKNGADVNLAGGEYGSALAAASYQGSMEIVHLLLKNGADVNLAGGEHGSALGAASYSNKVEIIHLLLENGANVNLVGGEYGSALAAVSYRGRVEIVRLLLKNGADVNLAGGEYGSALAAASYWGHEEIVHLLLKNGADVNLAGGEYGSALAAASYSSEAEIVRLLLENGADVNLVWGKYGSALAAASYGQEPKNYTPLAG
ncbi:p-loop containing nucleoside triphosphate hydrolase [Mycena venus]|uniref:p-loop containing nucleoside triphosphate hydrolase n=1 Tax=Mycena venus TaxID=2733690 RepID=A0A8H7CMC3_9AGAR|nr:p-loop containing nucleoside triphosphate hydrolase [Mycena venus]